MSNTEVCKLYLRKAQLDDCDLLFKWANDELVRSNAFNGEKIEYSQHMDWFGRVIQSDDIGQYILQRDKEPIGQIRINIEGNRAEIDYSISASERNCGYGKEIIRLIKERVTTDFPEVTVLVAKVKPSNPASYCCFAKNGFIEVYKQLEYDLSKVDSFI